MLILRVGDPHIKISNLAEGEKLMAFVEETARKYEVDRIELLGDLFHTHAIVRLEVMKFWEKWIDHLSQLCSFVVLVGNHDQTGDYSADTNALSIFKRLKSPHLTIVDKPTQIGIFAYVPYIHDEQGFNAAARGLYDSGSRVLVCHQTFGGAKYESGIYAPDGFNPEDLPYDLIISGHIHSRQRFGSVIYPGTAKWDTNADANESKGLWLVNHEEHTGAILAEQFIDTSGVVTPIRSIQWNEGELQPDIPGGRVTVELVGSSAWVKQQKENLKGKCGIKAKITDTKNRRERMASGGLLDFVQKYQTANGVTPDDVVAFMKEHKLV